MHSLNPIECKDNNNKKIVLLLLHLFAMTDLHTTWIFYYIDNYIEKMSWNVDHVNSMLYIYVFFIPSIYLYK